MIRAYLNDPISIIRRGTPNSFNEPGATTEELTLGYIEHKTRLVRNINGEEVSSPIQILMEYDSTLAHEDKIKIDSATYPIISIEVVRDFSNRGMWVYL